MLRNIPNKYMQSALLEEIDAAGFAETYDFFYLPMDVHNRANVGYAFINFLCHVDMVHFTEVFTDYVFQKHPSLKIARVSPAHVQGLVENLRHFSNRAVTWARNSQYRPIVKYQGVQRDLCEVIAELPPEGSTDASGDMSAAGEAGCVFDASAPEFVPERLGWLTAFNPDAAEFCPMGDLAGPYAEGFEPEQLAACLGAAFSPEALQFAPEPMESMMPFCAEPEAGAGGDGVPPGLQAVLAEEPWDGAGGEAEWQVAIEVPPGLMPPALCGAFAAGCARAPGDAECATACSATAPSEFSESLSAARAGLQEAVSKWLQGEEPQRRATGDASAAGDSSTRGSSHSPRSWPEGGKAAGLAAEAEAEAEAEAAAQAAAEAAMEARAHQGRI